AAAYRSFRVHSGNAWDRCPHFSTYTTPMCSIFDTDNFTFKSRASIQELRSMSALGQKRTFVPQKAMSALPPCVDGSELARTFLNVCSIGRCSHVFGLFARFT